MDHLSADSRKVIAYLMKNIRKIYGDRRPLRIFHAKSIGLVKAKFIVPDNLDPHLRVGFFASPGEYPAYIRFTSSKTRILPDNKPAVRGIAIKVRNVLGTPWEDADPGVQDFVLSNNRTFSPGSGGYTLSAVTILLGNWLEKAGGILHIFPRYFKGSLLFLKGNIQTPNVLEENYYSGTPYSFGENKAVKYYLRPLKTITSVIPDQPKDDFLRMQLAKDLAEDAKEPVAFDLYVQFQEDQHTEPIEDTTIIWKTPFQKVATINVPKQHIYGSEHLKLEKEMTFSPGNAIMEHAPLGSINRVRVDSYKAMASDRNAHPLET